MQNSQKFSAEIAGQTMTIETGLLAQQAAGAVTVSVGDTTVFCAVTCTDKPREGIDFFPLQCEYREKFYAAGRFPGGFFKREQRPSEKETLIARMCDRPIRPLFPDGYYNDVQVNSMLVSCDGKHEADILAVNAASAALHLSDVPFMGPIGCVRIGRINGEWVINPSHDERAQSDLDLLYAGLRGKFLMMEGSAKEISEADFLAAMKRAHEEVEKIIDLQIEMRRALGKPDKEIADIPEDPEKMNFIRDLGGARLADALIIPGKLERQAAVDAIRAELLAACQEKYGKDEAGYWVIDDVKFVHLFDALEIETVRANFLERGKRIDGRAQHEIRPLAAQVGVLSRTHGSAVFNRGETQNLATVTLGTTKDAQDLDSVTGGPKQKKFILHYNFPPYCTGEVGRVGTTGRREIGHGALAERSLAEVIPADYPYSVRVVSEIMGSNGSSSMASICGGCLALMDAGVPITAPVAGISVGLFTTPDLSKKVLVTDILGAEDHCGDMDFKIGGTRKGITGFQVDLKLRGLTWDLVEDALEAARVGRNTILDYMASVIPAPREELSPYAPRITTLTIPVDKIGELIGPGGKNIRRITDTTGVQIDIAEDGTVSIFATNAESMLAAKREVEAISAEAEEGKIYEGTVTGIKEFGCFVEILPGKDGLCHISELSDRRIPSVDSVCKIGDKMMVKCIGIDERGRVKLSRKEAMRDLDKQNNG
ncbi:MAG: polyribonucleotide nucleotidyltransferase [Kiritimatiellae bacterium]|nr:polyribonucleotide nucleotidyltransferase [Kiritimatiellia bacterium]MBR4946874.1 polyribonucleotide nucleotidyltransferase [Kiritimatiellia bacterium]MBR5588101.1 polyribonucleotide nucleotidyltransferase [Kiritimatiellia bacterium]